METENENVYEEVAYPGRAITFTHPDRFAVIGTLLGMPVAPTNFCRVLEIGCGDGMNLLPMAEYLPDSTFVGIDYTAKHIEIAQRSTRDLGLENLTFAQRDIRDLTPEDGQFDYIICHGVYSWVPDDVRDAVLRVCRENLAPAGIAYVSFNSLPGWYFRGALRDMMRFHTRNIADPRERVLRSHEFARFAARALPPEGGPYGYLLNEYVETLEEQTVRGAEERISFSLHDELNDINVPVYFTDFVEHAAAHGLRFLSDIELKSSLSERFPEWVNDGLVEMADSIEEMEQYRDFLLNRAFRRVLLCRAEVEPRRNLGINMETLRTFLFRAEARPDKGTPVEGNAVADFSGPDGAHLKLDHPGSKAALAYLAEQFPRPVPFVEMMETALGRAGLPFDGPNAGAVIGDLMHAYTYSSRLISLHVTPFPGVTAVSERPLAPRVARYQAGLGESFVANSVQMLVELNPVARYVLQLLDGTHTREMITGALLDLVAKGELDPGDEAEPGETVEARIDRQLDATLLDFAHHGLLLA